jgi:F-type H+-transporting ATPase subunit epsilon
MTTTLHLTITTPATVLVDSDDVVAAHAEDESGAFGILPGHADLLTRLTPSVVRWRAVDGATRFCAVRSGVLTVSLGRRIAIASREAIVGDALQTLEANVRTVRAQQHDADRRAHVEQVRLHALAVRQLVRYLRPIPGERLQASVAGDGEAAP